MPKQVSISITKMNEPTFEITLGNGAVIRVRTIVVNVDQLMQDDGITPVLSPDGKAMYSVNIQNLPVVIKDAVNKSEMN